MPDGSEDRERMARMVADADVLAADLLVGGPSRDAMDLVREHDWLELVASDPLLDEAEALIADLASPDLARDWRDGAGSLATTVEYPAGDHPALASAHRGEAGHLLTLDDDLRSASAGVAIKDHVEVSIRSPAAFVAVFDADALYETVFADADDDV